MSGRLKMGLCNIPRWEKVKKIILARNEKNPGAIKHPVCTVEQALQDPNVQKHFLFQRAQISGYRRQAKIANSKNVGNLVRDVKSLAVPYLFALVGYKPNKPSPVINPASSSSSQPKPVTMSEYAISSANANRYFVNKFLAGFRPEARERGRRRRVPPFNRQLQYYWTNNKNNLKNAMEEINKDANSVFQTAIAYGKDNESVLEKKKAAFKIALERYKQNKNKGRNYGEKSILNQTYTEADKYYDENDEEEGKKDEGKASDKK